LIEKHFLEPGDVAPCELLVYPLIACAARDERVHD
jgi:hypothetical protein